MIIKLMPQRQDNTLTVIKLGDKLVLNGELLDLEPLVEGSTLPYGSVANMWVSGDITRVNGEIEITLLLPHAIDASEAARFPTPLIITQDGPVELPV